MAVSYIDHLAGASVARIEDSLEALDKFEEQLEEVEEVAHIDRVVSPIAKLVRTVRGSTESPGTTRKSTSAAGPKRNGPRPSAAGSSRFNTVNPAKLQAARRASLNLSVDEKTIQSPARSNTLSRSRSLAERKKSTKPPTIPDFELPGDAVARKLRDQREARVQRSAEKATTAGSVSAPARVKSTKPLTRPNFELPGDAISKKKREEREAKLKAQEEEERKRREFKARPVRTSSVRSVHPKETVTSRARQNKTIAGDNPPRQVQSDTTPNKRLSVMARSPLSTGTASSLSPRGRSSNPGSSTPTQNISRATSTSASSVSGKPSSVSAEDAYVQRLRGKEVYARDNKYSEDRERERQEREVAAKLARQQAAERSRQASREWAEKQRQKRVPAIISSAHHVAVS